MFGDFRRECSVISKKLHPFIFLSEDVGQMSMLNLIYGGVGRGSLDSSASFIPSEYSSFEKVLECAVRIRGGHSAH